MGKLDVVMLEIEENVFLGKVRLLNVLEIMVGCIYLG